MDPLLPIDGVLPPDLQGTFVRIGPGGEERGALHAVELRDGTAVSYLTCDSAADANVFWQAGSLLALPECGLPLQYSRSLESQEFGTGLTVPIGSHVHRDARTGGRVIFGVEQGEETTQLRIGEWDAAGALASHMAVTLERATWQHDLGVTAGHIVVLASPTEYAADLADEPVPFVWTPGAQGSLGVVPRGGDGAAVRWLPLDPCLVTHILGAYEEEGSLTLFVCRYEAPEKGRPIDPGASVLAAAGIGESLIGGGLPVLERWRVSLGDAAAGGAGGLALSLERVQVDERCLEYPRVDSLCEGLPFRYGYAVEVAPAADPGAGQPVDHVGLLRFDTARDEVAVWSPGAHHTASEPIFVRAVDGRSDDEGWLLTVVDDATRAGTDLYVLDASSFGPRSRPQAVIHLPESVRLPFRSHGEWVGAERYR